jgi:hypothetical protein
LRRVRAVVSSAPEQFALHPALHPLPLQRRQRASNLRPSNSHAAAAQERTAVATAGAEAADERRREVDQEAAQEAARLLDAIPRAARRHGPHGHARRGTARKARADDVRQLHPRRVRSDWFGHGRHGARVKLVADLHAASGAYPERVVDSPNGDASSSPWLLKTKGVGAQHTDIAKRDPADRRGRAGDYRDAASLFMCLRGAGELTIYNSTDPAGDIDACTVVATIAFARGAWVTFPSRLLHRVVGGPRFVLNCLLMRR